MQEFTGRDELVSDQTRVRRPVYRAKVPCGWKRIETDGSLMDTKIPNIAFEIEEGLKVTVHTFPSASLETRIPPFAQVERWKRQLSGDVKTLSKQIAHGGFAGIALEAPTLLAWSMQLDTEHYQTLAFLANSDAEKEHYKQMSADYTIKATGPEELIEKHKEELFLFANSFELIQEIPRRM